jgi:hypothetical protein
MVDAVRFARSVETDSLRGDWIDPRFGQELFEVWSGKWADTLGIRKPSLRRCVVVGQTSAEELGSGAKKSPSSWLGCTGKAAGASIQVRSR